MVSLESRPCEEDIHQKNSIGKVEGLWGYFTRGIKTKYKHTSGRMYVFWTEMLNEH